MENIYFYKWMSFIWLTLCLIYSIYKISKRQLSSIYFVMITFFLLFALPLLFDLVFGLPDYSYQPGFQISQGDSLTNIVYLLYISYIPLLWLGLSRSTRLESNFQPLNFNMIITLGLYILMIAPLIILFLYPESRTQLDYGAITGDEIEANIANLVNTATFLSVFAVLIIFLTQRNILYSIFILLPWPILAIWLNGKRTIILLFLIGLIASLIFKHLLTGLRTIVIASLSLVAFFSYSNFYQSTVRSKGDSTLTSIEIYTGNRIDYGRDDVTKMTIYAELHPNEIKILEYRGQSFLFTLLPFVPRSVWTNKPMPYAQYFTSAMLLSPPKFWGWGMTTSILEEGIANFSWLGMLVSPLIILLLCRYGDRSKNLILSISTVLIASLLLAVQVIAFYPIIIIYFAYLIYKNRDISQRQKWGAISNGNQNIY